MEVEFTLTPADLVAFQHYHGDHSPSLRWMFPAMILLPLTLMGLTLILQSQGQNQGQNPKANGDDGEIWILLWTMLIIMVLLFLSRKRLRSLGVRLMLRSGGNAKLLQPQRVELAPEGLIQKTSFVSTRMLWSALEKIVLAPDHVFFYVLTMNAAVVPRRAFANDDEFHEFVALAQRYREDAKAAAQASGSQVGET